MPQIKLSDGTKLRTQSNRRYATFTIADDSRVTVQKRTDNRETAFKSHALYIRLGFLRVVTVDFADLGTAHTGPSVLRDSALR